MSATTKLPTRSTGTSPPPGRCRPRRWATPAIADSSQQSAPSACPQPKQYGPSRAAPSAGPRASRRRPVMPFPSAAPPPLRRGASRRGSDEPLPLTLQPPLQAARHVPAVLQGPEAPPTNPLRPGHQLLCVARLPRLSTWRPTSSTATALSKYLCTSTGDHDHLQRLLPLGATSERTGLNRGKLPLDRRGSRSAR